jgi:hypothetical protein
MPERNCQFNTGLESCGEEQPICPIPRKNTEYYSQNRYYAFTDIPLRNLMTGEIDSPTLVKVEHLSDPVWDLWDIPLEEIKRNKETLISYKIKAQVEARNLVQLQVKKKPRVIIQFPGRTPKVVEVREPLLSKRA